MKNKNTQSPSTLGTSQIKTVAAIPVKYFIHLFTKVIDLWNNLPVMNAVWRERRELERLMDQHIKDLGVTPDSVRREIKRGYFDIPEHRKRSCRSASPACYGKPI